MICACPRLARCERFFNVVGLEDWGGCGIFYRYRHGDPSLDPSLTGSCSPRSRVVFAPRLRGTPWRKPYSTFRGVSVPRRKRGVLVPISSTNTS